MLFIKAGLAKNRFYRLCLTKAIEERYGKGCFFPCDMMLFIIRHAKDFEILDFYLRILV